MKKLSLLSLMLAFAMPAFAQTETIDVAVEMDGQPVMEVQETIPMPEPVMDAAPAMAEAMPTEEVSVEVDYTQPEPTEIVDAAVPAIEEVEVEVQMPDGTDVIVDEVIEPATEAVF